MLTPIWGVAGAVSDGDIPVKTGVMAGQVGPPGKLPELGGGVGGPAPLGEGPSPLGVGLAPFGEGGEALGGVFVLPGLVIVVLGFALLAA